MQPIKFLAISTLLLLSSGCSIFGGPDERVVVKTNNVYLPILCPDPAAPAAITTLKVRPQVIEDKIGLFWVGLTGKDYENLAVNVQETIRYIKDQKAVTAYYRQCITDFNKQIEAQQENGKPP